MDNEKLKVLVVDDDDVDRQAVIRALEGFHAVPADSGSAALELLRVQKFDCILLDHLMPDYDSIQLLPMIRSAGVETPVVVVTGFGNEMLAVKMMKTGVSDYLPKDVLDARLLSKAIREAVRSHCEQVASDDQVIDELKEISQAAKERSEEIAQELPAGQEP